MIVNIKVLVCIVLGALLFIQCSSDEPDPNPNPGPDPPDMTVDLSVLRQQIAIQVGDHSIVPAFNTFRISAESLQSSMMSFTVSKTEQGLDQLRSSLKDLWLTWQDAAIYQMGPTESNALRVSINAYPTNSQKIESNISEGQWVLGSIENQGAEGLPAIDYIINSQSELASNLKELTDEENRMAYLSALVNRIVEKATVVAEEWQNGSFLVDFKSTTSNGTDVGSALGQIVNVMDLHLQRFLRDGKVAIPAGVRSAGVPRPRAVEALYSGYSGELLIKAIEAYIDLFTGIGVDGITGTSLQGYLVALEQESIGNDIVNALNKSLSQAKTLNNDFGQQIADDNEQMISTFLALQDLVTLFKSDMSSVMSITITNQDVDGD